MASDKTVDGRGPHRAEMKPGPVVRYAPLRAGETSTSAPFCKQDVKSGDNADAYGPLRRGGHENAVAFEYTLGAKEERPCQSLMVNWVMTVITAE